MNNKIKVWKKQEKRIIKLLYRKGLLHFDLSELYWAEYHLLGYGRRRGDKKYKGIFYAPEVHFCTVDYWGEADEHSAVSAILEKLYWDNAEIPIEDCDGEYPKSKFKFKGRLWFIKYLENMPTVKWDSKINNVLKFNFNY